MFLFRSVGRAATAARLLIAVLALGIAGLGAQKSDTPAIENGERLFAAAKFGDARDVYTRA